MSEPLRYTIDHVDALIRANQKYKSSLRRTGRLDEFMRPVSPAKPAAAGAKKPEPVTHEAFCVRCKAKKIVETKKIDPTERGVHHSVGTCPDCGTSVHSFHNAADGKRLADALASASASYAYPV